MRVFQAEALTVTIDLTALDCPNCGIVYGVTEEFRKRKRDDGTNWYCPNGHSIAYTDSELTRTKKALAEEQSKTARLVKRLKFAEQQTDEERVRREATERSLTATKGVVTKMRKRVQAGACPVPGCKRSFAESALARHLATKHPDWQPEAAPPATRTDGEGETR